MAAGVVPASDRRKAQVAMSPSRSLERRTTDGGASWHDLNMPIPAFFFDVYFLDNMRGWMVGGDGSQIVRTTDGGNTWTAHNTPSPYTLDTVHFSDANNGWAGGSYGSLVHTPPTAESPGRCRTRKSLSIPTCWPWPRQARCAGG